MKSYILFILSIMGIFSFMSVNAQINIKGVVTSKENNKPLVGVTVLEKGTSKGTSTNTKGEFILSVKGPDSKVEFSMLGYMSVVETVGNKTVLNIVMVEENINMEELVVVGYGTMRKSDITGSLSSIKQEDIIQSKTTSLDQMLAGRASGVLVTSSAGEPGAGLTMRIRGTSSLNANNEPLYVIDGFPIEKDETLVSAYRGLGNQTLDPLANMNPNDIASIEILKDASATAIYGSRGGNGVVLITTKSGGKSRPKVEFNTFIGASWIDKRIPMADKQEYVNFVARCAVPSTETESPFYTSVPHPDPAYPDELINIPRNYADSIGRNWQDEVFRTALQQNYDLSVSGGSENTKYFISYGYTSQEGTVPHSDFERTSFRVKLDQKINRYISVGASVTYSTMLQNGMISSGGQGANSGIFQQILMYRPTYQLRTIIDEEEFDTTQSTNPLLYLDNMTRKNSSNRFQANTYADIKLHKNLNLRITYSALQNNAYTNEFFSKEILQGKSTDGKVTTANAQIKNWSQENILTYKLQKGHHNINLMGAISLQKNYRKSTAQTGIKLTNESLKGESIPFASELQPVTNDIITTTMLSYLGRLNYSYKDKYIFTASIRGDGSSKFTEGNKFAYFPSAAFAWYASQEPFLQRLNIFHTLKFRMSYGQAGNSSIPALSTLQQMSPVYYTIDNQLYTGFALGNLGNNLLTWETSEQVDFGVDMAFFKGRLSLAMDIYHKQTKNMLLQKEISYINGGNSAIMNFGKMRNQGLEIAISSVNISKKNFEWSTDLNMTFNRNKILDLGAMNRYPVDAPLHPSIYYNEFTLSVGQPVGTMYGYWYEGVYQYADFEEFYRPDGTFISDVAEQRKIYANIKNAGAGFTVREGVPTRFGVAPEPGFARFKDLDGDGDISTGDEDKDYIGYSEPKVFGGISNRFRFWDLDLSLFFQYSIGNSLFNANNHALMNGAGGTPRNILKAYYEGEWLPDRPTNLYPTASDYVAGICATSSMNVYDASYLRLKDVTLGYTLPASFSQKLKLSSIRIYVSGQNLWTLTNYPWSDPEVVFRDPLASGYDRFTYPRSVVILGGLSITF